MLSNDIKKELREYFNIKNISVAKQKAGIWDVNLYYDSLLLRKNAIENEKKMVEEQKQEEEKRKLKNKLKKLRKRINKQAKKFASDSDNDSEDEVEQVKPYIFFIPQLQPLFTENLYLIGLLNNYYETNENYKDFLIQNEYEKIKITRQLHTGFTDPLHFNGYFLTRDDSKMSGCIHFYVENGVIKKISMIMEVF
jgi:hypothetical protein